MFKNRIRYSEEFKQQKDTEGILLHSALRVQYTSHAFETCLKKRGIVHSFSHKEPPYDNACIESFHSILKKKSIKSSMMILK